MVESFHAVKAAWSGVGWCLELDDADARIHLLRAASLIAITAWHSSSCDCTSLGAQVGVAERFDCVRRDDG